MAASPGIPAGEPLNPVTHAARRGGLDALGELTIGAMRLLFGPVTGFVYGNGHLCTDCADKCADELGTAVAGPVACTGCGELR